MCFLLFCLTYNEFKFYYLIALLFRWNPIPDNKQQGVTSSFEGRLSNGKTRHLQRGNVSHIVSRCMHSLSIVLKQKIIIKYQTNALWCQITPRGIKGRLWYHQKPYSFVLVATITRWNKLTSQRNHKRIGLVNEICTHWRQNARYKTNGYANNQIVRCASHVI